MTVLTDTADLYEDVHELWHECKFERVERRTETKLRPDLLRSSWKVELVCSGCPERRVIVDTYSLLSIDPVRREPTPELEPNTLWI